MRTATRLSLLEWKIAKSAARWPRSEGEWLRTMCAADHRARKMLRILNARLLRRPGFDPHADPRCRAMLEELDRRLAAFRASYGSGESR